LETACALFAYCHNLTVTKAQYEQIKRDCHHLALDIGVRPAARALSISESRALKWSHREKWNVGLIRPPSLSIGGNGLKAPESGGITDAIEAKRRIIEHYGDRAKIGATIAGAKALEHLADSNGAELCKPAAAISADQWTKAVDRAAGWTAARQQGVQVAVQVNLPSAEEKAELRETDAKLDEIAALLRNTRPKA